jgi:serine/threonine protein kinase
MSPLPEDDDRTVIRPATSKTVTVAADPPSPPDEDEDTHALPQGTMLGEFELTRKIGEGGFSIVYMAQDRSLDRRVALKEYMPSSIAARKGRTMVSARSERHKDTFEAGLKSFINEAKLLAQFDHRSLVKVYRFWEANGTAYMIMPFYEGVTLKDTVQAMAQPPDEDWLLDMLGPLTEALCVIHAEQCYHRDIAPDNVILLKDDDRPLLLDFGAARKVIGGMTQALTVILKPGYAPVEQYAELPDMKQGPWTDVYALAATVYWTITGKTPPPAVGRMLGDNYKPLVECAAGRYSDRFLQAVDRALVVRPEQRTPTIRAFRQDIGLEDHPDLDLSEEPVQETGRTVARTVRGERTRTVTQSAPPKTTDGLRGPATEQRTQPGQRAAPVPTPSAKDGAPSSASAGRPVLWLAGIVLLMAAGGAAWWALKPQPQTTSAAPMAKQPTTPAPVIATPPSPPPVAEVASAATPTSVVQPPSAPTVVEAPTPAPVEPTITAEPAPPPVVTAKPIKPPKKNPTATAKTGENTAECGRILQRMSLGDSSPELLNRLKTLGCR